MLAKTLVRSNKAKGRLYTARATMTATVNELTNMAATMRLASSMEKSTEVMQQVNQLVKVPELQETMQSLQKEMFKAGLIEEMIDEGLEDIDGPELEEEAEVEVDKVLEDLAIDSSIRMAVCKPEAAAAAAVTASANTAAVPQTGTPANPAAVGASS